MRTRTSILRGILVGVLAVLPWVVWSAEFPAYQFQSTSSYSEYYGNDVSTLSSYSPDYGNGEVSLPALEASRQNSANWAAAQVQSAGKNGSGPKRVGPVTPTDPPTPVGDGLVVLLLMACGYICLLRRTRSVK